MKEQGSGGDSLPPAERESAPRKRVFVAGTDTDVGKTVAAAWLMRRYKMAYWKPVQSGLEGETDEQVIRRLSKRPAKAFHPSTYTLQRPMSPHASAALEGVTIDMERFKLPESKVPLLVEGAGGLMVPMNDDALMIDLMVQLALPVILVARTALGTINHTLLSLEAMRSRGLEIVGVILSGPPNASNFKAIECYGRTPILAEIPQLTPLTPEALDGVKPLAGKLLKEVLR
ncbi:MAG: dethiobiotin synthase [Magnetococcales bacterium]|nr:dethiobiotin synthase [Magnetococcales bacterium]